METSLLIGTLTRYLLATGGAHSYVTDFIGTSLGTGTTFADVALTESGTLLAFTGVTLAEAA